MIIIIYLWLIVFIDGLIWLFRIMNIHYNIILISFSKFINYYWLYFSIILWQWHSDSTVLSSVSSFRWITKSAIERKHRHSDLLDIGLLLWHWIHWNKKPGSIGSSETIVDLGFSGLESRFTRPNHFYCLLWS